ncbi:hypothetical protein [Flammeovirga pacifica]|uniref:Fibronectin type-III domain-containing protein n=1 Tax=Flammeovirga pacifica TaxID=915059 RepID=A0A1S1YSY7_FLAPC|nr:hypothetical protein [Flammeovirga pacifica]OHX64139.1 hypothetical protein NH26_21275 [Flammeovirga pacifica]
MKNLNYYIGILFLFFSVSFLNASNIPEKGNPEKTSEVEDFNYKNGMLQWETYSGVDVQYFLIESSSNSNSWKLVNEVNAHQKTRYKQRYSYDVKKPKKYYRLSVINTKGEIKPIGVLMTTTE